MKRLLLLLALACAATPACKKKSETLPEPGESPSAPTTSTSVSTSAPAPTTATATAAPTAPAPSLKTFPGTEAGAKALLAEFVKPGADTAGLSAQLRPTTADYKAIFDPTLSAKLEKVYTPQWESGAFVVAPKQGQTTVLIDSATVAELKSGAPASKEFPGGYKMVASHLVGAARLYRFKFVEPGKTLGMAFDGLAHVNGHWVLIPKPWRALDDH
ncbi:MAG TPA: hypothetical protein VLT33_12965 [Labilithrix sp.]|nr:hypothetical protein [Labilithrix sp.]